jgi:hypothetical protein
VATCYRFAAALRLEGAGEGFFEELSKAYVEAAQQ